MKQEESQILNQIGKESGFKVPDNYFEDFGKRMENMLPEVEITNVNAKPSTWLRIRPYVYLAAMFAGIWCMMKVFNNFNGTASNQLRVNEIAAGIQVENNAEDFLMMGGASDYDVFSYEDSVAMSMDEPLPDVNQP
ncbi:MAG: hypothetical protein II786_08350 [Muribaculaceae bacterium]|nr:hypothetical protein [Muribaculaceae bacterium]MBR3102020.1 hypothetical protein [Muribaculaceae bacterium]